MKNSIIVLSLLVGFLFIGCDKDNSSQFTTVDLTPVFPKDADHSNRCTSTTGMNESTLKNATAQLEIKAENGKTTGKIILKNGMPETVYTIWIRMDGTSPLTEKTATPLANPSDLKTLATVTLDDVFTDAARDLGFAGDDGSGSGNLSILKNAFQTDANGAAEFDVDLDFELIGGDYPFDEVDSSLSAVKINDETTTDNRIISIVSHCNTNKGYGMVGKTPEVPNEGWFDLTENPFD